jgi:hypothetical protein
LSLLPAIAEKAIKLYAGSHKISKVKELNEKIWIAETKKILFDGWR